ncbi:hypothetical protein SAMN05421787_11410 [Virgibacillus pantothenticus]|nr:hypothetical protein SAMN05421787_11410 [Virgibacillus pantothenticus]
MLSPYSEIYDLVVPKDNFLRRLNELVDFSFVYDELSDKYCIRMVGMQLIQFVCLNIYSLKPSLICQM